MKNILVTGASRGLGLAIVKALLNAEEDYNVVTLSRSKGDELQDLLKQYKNLSFQACDLEELDKIPALVSELTKKHGSFYGLVNNAALGLDGVLATQHNKDIARNLTVNLQAPITLTKYLCRGMLAKKSGRIINISSIIASTGFSGLAVYGATKAGLEGFTRSLSRELGRANITVNAVAPGYMETDMTASLGGDKLASIKRRAPLGLPEPKDVAEMVVFLLSERANKITGSILKIDGGSTA